MPRIFITGDCHAEYKKFSFKAFPEGRSLSKEDFVIVCGDFGLWDESAEQEYWLDWLEERPFSTLWIDGNHENYDLLKQIPIEYWHGGKVQFIRPSVIHLMRGQVYDIAGKRFFTFGGARSHDIGDGILERDDPDLIRKNRRLKRRGASFRINHLSWWREEMPSEAEMAEGLKNLKVAGWEVDVILTHCCAASLMEEAAGGPCKGDALMDFFSEIRKNAPTGIGISATTMWTKSGERRRPVSTIGSWS